MAFSGGKDSIACYLHLLDCGVPAEKIELHHHCVDGREGSTLMDWPCTESYCEAFAKHFGSTLYLSWKEGGFEREMLRKDARTAPIKWQNPDGTVSQKGGTGGKESTRRMFPQVTASLSQRWCSAYLKIDVSACVIRNSERFKESKTLVVTGERAQESAARAKYETFEPDRSDGRESRYKRHVDHWRPVHAWSEEEVWEIIERYKVLVHPAYRLGWGRLSCMSCIFGSKNQWASVRKVSPSKFDTIAAYEQEFGKTIHRTKSVDTLADAGESYAMSIGLRRAAMSKDYSLPITTDKWELPAGAYAEAAGPT
jgi:3'-phosphoadenosine 5'-phosphosulfate sulfotransferase (PAPS reductase)/FAD synthetase